MSTSPVNQPYTPFTVGLEHDQIQPLIIGHLISFSLFGVGLLQFFHVFRQLDRLRRRNGKLSTMDKFHYGIVTVLVVSDLLDAIFKGLFLDNLIRRALLGGIEAAQRMPRSIFALCFTDGWIAMVTHVIYVVRIIRINRATTDGVWWIWVLSMFAMGTSVAQFIASILTGIHAWGPMGGWEESMTVTAKLWLGGASVCDWFLCIVFVLSLTRHRSDFKSTNSLISRWVVFTLETGLLTSVLQAIDLILFLTFEGKPYHMVCAVILPKIYIISILIMLSTIYNTRLGSGAVITGSFPYTKSHDGGHAKNTLNGIHITSEVHTQGELPIDRSVSDYEKDLTKESQVRSHRYHPSRSF